MPWALDLDATDAGRAVPSQGGHRLLAAGVEDGLHTRCKSWFRVFDIAPSGRGYEGSFVDPALQKSNTPTTIDGPRIELPPRFRNGVRVNGSNLSIGWGREGEGVALV
jgi:hypothetical protein